MSTAAKVFWCDGDNLRPQHFQQQDRYFEARLQRASQSLHPYFWGVTAIEWDTPALEAHRLRLHALSAIFRDGEYCNAPASDKLPPAVDLNTIKPEVQEITYFAALPSLAPDSSNCAPAGAKHHNARYAQFTRTTADMCMDSEPEELRYLSKEVRLLSDQEPLGGYECIPLIRLRRTASGGFEADPAFIPPCLSVDASPRLRILLEQLIDAMQAKVNSLQSNMREPSRNVLEFRTTDMSAFWLLHSISTAGAQLMHYVRNQALHPERLFEAMLLLAGALLTYSKAYSLATLPTYEHHDPGKCFLALNAVARDLLDTVISARYFSIPLVLEKTCYHKGKLDSGKIDQNTALYLAVSAAMPALELVATVPRLLKIGAPDDVEQCVLSAVSGVKVSHAPQVPSAIPVRPHTYYFLLDSKSALYEQMLKSQSITIYAPGNLNELRLELIAVTA